MANNVSFAGPAAGSLVSPATQKVTLSSNYLNFHGTDGKNWSQQFLPELYAQEVERYGNRSVSSFLRMVGAEMPMASDQVIWSEQGRLHLAYNGTVDVVTGIVTAITGIDSGATEAHAVRKGATVVAVVEGVVFKARVNKGIEDATADYANGVKLDLMPYGAENINDLAGTSATGSKAIKFFVYGSEFGKGTDSMTNAIEPNFKSFTNRPIIIKDHFEVSGSDTAQIGWVEVSGESGAAGYLWYMKAEGDTRVRFEDYLEMSMIEAEKVATSGTATADSQLHDLTGGGVQGTEGLLSAIGSRGIVSTNQFDSGAVLSEFDDLLKELDKQGAIEENMMFLNRDANLVVDDLLAGLNPNISTGVNYGVFENSADMALNLGFSGFRRGSYDFYKTDWKYLNDKSTRGLVGGLKGLLVPAGTSSVYDQMLGKNVRRPFLHVRYRASETDDRRMKSWITGSVGGASTTGKDNMEVHYLSERCLVVQAANNFIRFDS
tara:strand:+ start:1035 stop:2507 length:1473 start_codon:yes stop_codon:yes gene_type:complete